MRNLRVLLLIISLVVLAISFARTYNDTGRCLIALESPAWQEVVEYARENLPLKGRLHVKSDGFGYVKVDDEYIHTLFPMLGLYEEGFREPPYFRGRESPGAHISVFYVDEHVKPKEGGQTFHFTLKDIAIVCPSKNSSYAILQVDAPELEKLREKYGLSGKLHGHEFHISLAKKTHSHFRD